MYKKNFCFVFFLLFLFILTSCSFKPGISKKEFKRSIVDSEVFAKNFTGFALYDIEDQKMVFEENSSKYFTPASNMKLLTFYAGIRLLGDSIPALNYTVCNDSLIFRGTGDPTFLHPAFSYSNVYEFLNNREEKIFYTTQKYSGESLGPGWAWDWYKYSYFTEKAPFPIYSNLVRFNISLPDTLPRAQPDYFSKFLQKKENQKSNSPVVRDMGDNVFFYNYNGDKQTTRNKADIPFKYTPDLLVSLLSDTLHRSVGLIEKKKCTFEKTIYSVPSDSVYKKMLQESDNFIAEQLLLIYSSEILDSLNSDMAINFIRDSLYKDLPDKPIWLDGSGLSRYNLITPRSMVGVLRKIYSAVPQERLFHLMASGGATGTLKEYYKGNTEPYIYAKSGTLSNNISLSGFLITKKGKPLIFSFMHNNHVISASSLRKEMERVLKDIYERY